MLKPEPYLNFSWQILHQLFGLLIIFVDDLDDLSILMMALVFIRILLDDLTNIFF